MEPIAEQIKSAFEGVPAPTQERLLHFSGVGDDLWIESFLGHDFQSWSEIPGESIASENAALTVFSPEAFVFFLPAYMTWVLQNYESSESSTIDNTLYDLDLTGRDTNTKQIMLERFERLSPCQKRATLSFLNFMSESGRGSVDTAAAKQAIGSYWGRFDSEI